MNIAVYSSCFIEIIVTRNRDSILITLLVRLYRAYCGKVFFPVNLKFFEIYKIDTDSIIYNFVFKTMTTCMDKPIEEIWKECHLFLTFKAFWLLKGILKIGLSRTKNPFRWRPWPYLPNFWLNYRRNVKKRQLGKSSFFFSFSIIQFSRLHLIIKVRNVHIIANNIVQICLVYSMSLCLSPSRE